MKHIILFLCMLFFQVTSTVTVFAQNQNYNFGQALSDSINTKDNGIAGNGGLQARLQGRVSDFGSEGVANFVIFLAIKVLLPITVLAGIVVAFIGFYKMMASDKEDEQKKGSKFLLRGTVGVITMVMATYLVDILVGAKKGPYSGGLYQLGIGGIFGKIGAEGGMIAGQQIAEQVYNMLVFPLLKLAMVIIIGILFIILFINLFQYLFSPAEDIQKKALTIIIRNTLGILTIVLAKTIIEFIFGKYETVVNADDFKSGGMNFNSTTSNNLGKIGTPFGEITVQLDKLFTILNRLLGLLTLIILILIIYQGFKLLFNPTDAGGLASVGKTIGYIFLGILLLGFGYLIANAILPVA